MSETQDIRKLARGYYNCFEVSFRAGRTRIKKDAPEAVHYLISASYAEDSGADHYVIEEVRSALNYILMIGDEITGIEDEADAKAAIQAHGDLKDFTDWLNSRPDERGTYLDAALSRARSGQLEAIPQTAYALLRDAKEDEMRDVFDKVVSYLKRRAVQLETSA